MLPPTLVIADQPARSYPGGVVVVRCTDWLGPSRSTLTTESDPRSCAGTVVRESQQSNTIVLDHLFYTEWKNAPSTLVIPLGDIGLHRGFNQYRVLISLLIEGSWDPDVPDSAGSSSQEQFFHKACQLMFWGDKTRPIDSPLGPYHAHLLPRGLNSYRIVGFAIVGKLNFDDLWENYTIYIKGISAAGSTIEFLLDQLYFIPSLPEDTNPWNKWKSRIVSAGDLGLGVYGGHPADGPPNYLGWFEDGTDGGDILGKFTRHPYPLLEPTGYTYNGGGDYQKSDNEYYLRVVGYEVENSSDFSDGQYLSSISPSHKSYCYSACGPYYVPTQIWVQEDFARTIGDWDLTGPDGHFEVDYPWGSTPEGFGWTFEGLAGPYSITGCTSSIPRHGRAGWVEDGEAGMFTKWAQSTGGSRPYLHAILSPTSQRAGILSQNICATGFCRHELVESPTVLPGSDSENGSVVIISTLPIHSPYVEGNIAAPYIIVNLQFKWWEIRLSGNNSVIGTRQDISSWLAPGVTFGFRLEVERYKLRVRIWNASNSEPANWDFDDFRPGLKKLYEPPFYERREYPYQDDLRFIEEGNLFGPLSLRLVFSNADHDFYNNYAVYWNSIQVYHDVMGPNRSSSFSLERPEGNEIGRITIPAGCQHMVYWGKRTWTEPDDVDAQVLDFSMKAWNHPSAGLLQRAEVPWVWFGSILPMPIAAVQWKYPKKQPTKKKFRR